MGCSRFLLHREVPKSQLWLPQWLENRKDWRSEGKRLPSYKRRLLPALGIYDPCGQPRRTRTGMSNETRLLRAGCTVRKTRKHKCGGCYINHRHHSLETSECNERKCRWIQGKNGSSNVKLFWSNHPSKLPGKSFQIFQSALFRILSHNFIYTLTDGWTRVPLDPIKWL